LRFEVDTVNEVVELSPLLRGLERIPVSYHGFGSQDVAPAIVDVENS
jgi:hypothetical protein